MDLPEKGVTALWLVLMAGWTTVAGGALTPGLGLILALQKFEGTLVFISHDVHFIRSLGTKVLHIVDGKVTAYAGDYDYYLQKTGAEENARAAVVAGEWGEMTNE